MKISDEIREWCKWCDERSAARDSLCKLADRIDSEMVELPKDRDGVPIRLGDTMYYCNSKFPMKILSLSFDGQWHLTTNKAHIHDTSFVTHERKDSLERIADDIEARLGTGVIDGSTLCKWVERIRKLAEKEDV